MIFSPQYFSPVFAQFLIEFFREVCFIEAGEFE